MGEAMIFAAIVLIVIGAGWTLLGATALGSAKASEPRAGGMALFMSLSGIAVLIIGAWIGALS